MLFRSSPGVVDLIVGGCWLGGVLAVFQSVGLVLRECYVQAQRRFIERTVFSKTRDAWSPSTDSSDDEKSADDTKRSSWLPWKRRSSDEDADESLDPESDDDSDAEESLPDEKTNRSKSIEQDDEYAAPPGRLLGIFPHRKERNEDLGDQTPDRIDEEIVVDQGLTKKPGWFQWKRTKQPKVKAPAASTKSSETVSPNTAKTTPLPSTSPKPSKKPWLPSFGRKSIETSETASNGVNGETEDKKSIASTSTQKVKQQTDSETTTPKKKWFAFGTKKPKSATTDDKDSSNRVEAFEVLDEIQSEKPKLLKRIRGLFDGLTFRPPKQSDSNSSADSEKTNASSVSNSTNAGKGTPTNSGTTQQASQSKPGPLSGFQAGANTSKANPVSQADEEDSGDDGNDYRHLSKAERKRMRRQQNDRGAA